MRSLRSSVNVRRVGQIGVDAGLIALAYYLSYVLRFDEGIPPRYEDLLGHTIGFVVVMISSGRVACMMSFRLTSATLN